MVVSSIMSCENWRLNRMRRARIGMTGLVCALAVTACSGEPDQAGRDQEGHPPTLIPQLAAANTIGADEALRPDPDSAPAYAREVDPDAFAHAMKAHAARVIDVRTPAEFAQGAIRGAENIPLDTFKAQDFVGIDAEALDKPLLLYCRSGRRSAQALALLEAAGVKGAVHLEGGILAWQRSGYAVKTP